MCRRHHSLLINAKIQSKRCTKSYVFGEQSACLLIIHVERWFAEITRKRIRRGSFKSVPDLIQTIEDYIRTNNKSRKPFVWTKKPADILKKIALCKAATVTLHLPNPFSLDASLRGLFKTDLEIQGRELMKHWPSLSPPRTTQRRSYRCGRTRSEQNAVTASTIKATPKSTRPCCSGIVSC
jgi:hypothetical protein